MVTTNQCVVCRRTAWVCENHEDRPSKMFGERFDACDCGAGMACLVCNQWLDLFRAVAGFEVNFSLVKKWPKYCMHPAVEGAAYPEVRP
jgi:hypothetical protein